jgi:hypothetical protein
VCVSEEAAVDDKAFKFVFLSKEKISKVLEGLIFHFILTKFHIPYNVIAFIRKYTRDLSHKHTHVNAHMSTMHCKIYVSHAKYIYLFTRSRRKPLNDLRILITQ